MPSSLGQFYFHIAQLATLWQLKHIFCLAIMLPASWHNAGGNYEPKVYKSLNSIPNSIILSLASDNKSTSKKLKHKRKLFMRQVLVEYYYRVSLLSTTMIKIFCIRNEKSLKLIFTIFTIPYLSAPAVSSPESSPVKFWPVKPLLLKRVWIFYLPDAYYLIQVTLVDLFNDWYSPAIF